MISIQFMIDIKIGFLHKSVGYLHCKIANKADALQAIQFFLPGSSFSICIFYIF